MSEKKVFNKILQDKENRIRLIAVAIILAYLAILFKIILIYVGDDTSYKAKQSTTFVNLKKYNILDANGNLLATTINSYNFYISPAKTVFAEEMLEKLSRIFPESLEETDLLERLKNKQNKLVLIKREITEAQKNAIIEAGVEAAEFEKTYTRVYPYGNIFSHIVGYVNASLEGVLGLERNFNSKLYYEDVQTSLDARIQVIMHSKMLNTFNEYKTNAGFGIVLNMQTGEIVSLISLPDFNPKNVSNPNGENMKNNAILSTYHLGSVYKILTIAMGVENGITEEQLFKVDKPIVVDRTFTLKDEKVRKPLLNISEILAFSSNVGSVQLLEEIGIEKQRKFFEEIGVFSPPRLELSPYEIATPIFKSGVWHKSVHYTATYGYGVSLSPIHFANLARIVIGTGKKNNLTLLKVQGDEEVEEKVILSPKTIKTMQHVLRDVIKIGTAKLANVNGYEICGKTSTIYKFDTIVKKWSHERKMVSFLSFFPCTNPKYLIYIGYDEPKKTEKDPYIQGGTVVAPLAAELISEIAPLLNIKPDAI